MIKCKTALLLTDIDSFATVYRRVARQEKVTLTVAGEWKEQLRVNQEVIILGSKFLNKLNKAYYSHAVVILKEGERAEPYIEMGISKFVFNHKNEVELAFAFYKAEKILVHSSSVSFEELTADSEIKQFGLGEYNFDFDRNRFAYKGKLLYLTGAQKHYLAEWLLYGNKDNNKRMVLCKLRKKFGKDFLKDINRFGELKEEKDEQ